MFRYRCSELPGLDHIHIPSITETMAQSLILRATLTFLSLVASTSSYTSSTKTPIASPSPCPRNTGRPTPTTVSVDLLDEDSGEMRSICVTVGSFCDLNRDCVEMAAYGDKCARGSRDRRIAPGLVFCDEGETVWSGGLEMGCVRANWTVLADEMKISKEGGKLA
ncbi:unnamed protein product [Diplocarpon coronariae]|uniref:Uncharacterized protein n=1 Tax=Diplocarpon coronariae TaxID=2795749 RepID=A0A218ZHM5_9HELO|nr:hypothetical protein B2J93_5145 [Marssonina coronariae]